MKIDLSFTKVGDGVYEAVAANVSGRWQLYAQLPSRGKSVKVFSRAGADEEWVRAGAQEGDGSGVVVMPFVSIVPEFIKIVSSCMPAKANIRTEE